MHAVDRQRHIQGTILHLMVKKEIVLFSGGGIKCRFVHRECL